MKVNVQLVMIFKVVCHALFKNFDKLIVISIKNIYPFLSIKINIINRIIK